MSYPSQNFNGDPHYNRQNQTNQPPNQYQNGAMNNNGNGRGNGNNYGNNPNMMGNYNNGNYGNQNTVRNNYIRPQSNQDGRRLQREPQVAQTIVENQCENRPDIINIIIIGLARLARRGKLVSPHRFRVKSIKCA